MIISKWIRSIFEFSFCQSPDMFLLKEWPTIATPESPSLAYYRYMVPPFRHLKDGIMRLTGADIGAELLPTGPSPGLFHRDQFAKIMPVFEETMYNMWHEDFVITKDWTDDKAHPEYWGWLRDMYAFVVALHQLDVTPIVKKELMMVPEGKHPFSIVRNAQLFF